MHRTAETSDIINSSGTGQRVYPMFWALKIMAVFAACAG
jgi:hypothetical protein